MLAYAIWHHIRWCPGTCTAYLGGRHSCPHTQATNSGSLEVLPHLGGTVLIVGLLVLQHDNVVMQESARSRGFLSRRKVDCTKLAASRSSLPHGCGGAKGAPAWAASPVVRDEQLP